MCEFLGALRGMFSVRKIVGVGRCGHVFGSGNSGAVRLCTSFGMPNLSTEVSACSP